MEMSDGLIAKMSKYVFLFSKRWNSLSKRARLSLQKWLPDIVDTGYGLSGSKNFLLIILWLTKIYPGRIADFCSNVISGRLFTSTSKSWELWNTLVLCTNTLLGFENWYSQRGNCLMIRNMLVWPSSFLLGPKFLSWLSFQKMEFMHSFGHPIPSICVLSSHTTSMPRSKLQVLISENARCQYWWNSRSTVE
jgi:hypothetical protein